MPARALHRIRSPRRVAELGPRNGDEVAAGVHVEIAVGAVGNVQVVHPDVMRAVRDADGVLAAAALPGAVRAVVSDDLDVAQDHVDASR